jgi:hypothetical protein
LTVKIEKHFRLPEPTVGKLEDLVIPGRRTQTDAVVMAIDLLHGRAAHDDAVDMLVEELRALRQESEKQAETIKAMGAKVDAIESIAAAVAALERSIDKLGEHQVQLASVLNERLAPQPASNGSGGFFGRRA